MSDKLVFVDLGGTLYPRRFSLCSSGADPVLVLLLNTLGECGWRIMCHSTLRVTADGAARCKEKLLQAGIHEQYIHPVVTVGSEHPGWEAIRLHVDSLLNGGQRPIHVLVVDDEDCSDSFRTWLLETDYPEADCYIQVVLSDTESGIDQKTILDICCLDGVYEALARLHPEWENIEFDRQWQDDVRIKIMKLAADLKV